MAEDYVAEYERLLKETLRGARLRAFFLGYGSERLGDYLASQKQKIWAFEYKGGQEIYTRKNMDLASKLLGWEVKAIKAKLQF